MFFVYYYYDLDLWCGMALWVTGSSVPRPWGAGGYVAFSPHRVLASVFGSSKKNKRSADLLEDNSFLFILQLFL